MTELLGRDTETATLASALAADRAVVVAGEPGIGKTALVRAVVRASGRTAWEGGAFATLDWLPYLALRRALRLPVSSPEPWGDPAFVADRVEQAVGPDVLVLDDLQWADQATLDVAGLLVGRIAIVAVARAGPAGSALEALTAAGLDRLDLPPLELPDAARLAILRRPGLGAARATRIAERAGGNPLLVEALATTAGDEASARLILDAAVRAVPPADRPTLGLLALAGRPVPVAWVDGDGDALAAAGLAERHDGQLSIRHALLADAVVAALDPAERAAIHVTLAGRVADDGERARHLAGAGDRAGAHAAAMRAATTATGPGERAAHLGLAASTADGPEADDLRIRAATELRVAGQLALAGRLLDDVKAGDPRTRARVDLVAARLAWSAGDTDAMRVAIERGLDEPGIDGTIEAIGLATERVVVVGLVDGAMHDGLALADRAIADAQVAGVPALRARLLRGTLLAGLGEAGWEAALEDLVADARAGGDVETELAAANNLISGHEMHGRPAAGRAVVDRMLERSRDLRLAAWERQFAALRVNLDLHAGALEAVVMDGEALIDRGLDPLALQQVGLSVALAETDLGFPDRARARLEPLLAAASPDITGRGNVLYVRAETELWGGRPSRALADVEAFRAFGEAEYGHAWLVDVTAGWAAREHGSAPPPRIASGEAVGMLAAAALERDALDALADGRPLESATVFAAAAEAYGAYHRRGAVRSAWGMGEALRIAGDEAAARAVLLDAEREAEAMALRPILGRVHRSLRHVGERRSARSTAPIGDARLSAREHEVALLVGAGLSNIEIARRLGVGRPTVARLLGSAMSKLGVDSRAQVAARLAQPVA